ncbi:MAG: tetratricopeptide repeat protein [Bacteroidetes bacterium]|jgi:tetratricopeptide (TPR) repeat protein|nr:tetratricopeptide repeat protein [Bacteroidota bacterium]
MTARYCPQCGTEVAAGFNFCPSCGAKIPEVHGEPISEVVEKKEEAREELVCPTCGFRNKIDSRSCESCGTFLGGAKTEVVEHHDEVASSSQAAAEPKKPAGRQTQRKQSQKQQGKKVNEQRKPQQASASGKKLHLEPYQIASIAAAILLGGILVYGLMSSKPTASSQDVSGATSQQQTTSTGQPSADVLHEINRLREVVDKDPSDFKSTLKLANMLQDNQMYDQAAIYYKRYLADKSTDVNARVDYGVTLFEGGHTQEALDELKQALKMDPRHQIGWFNIAVVYMNLGEFDKANDALKKCVKIDPNTDIGKRAQQTLVEHANIGNQEVK